MTKQRVSFISIVLVLALAVSCMVTGAMAADNGVHIKADNDTLSGMNIADGSEFKVVINGDEYTFTTGAGGIQCKGEAPEDLGNASLTLINGEKAYTLDVRLELHGNGDRNDSNNGKDNYWINGYTQITKPVPSKPVPSKPVPSEPVPSEPVPSEPVPSEPVPSEPAPSEPVPSEPVTTPIILPIDPSVIVPDSVIIAEPEVPTTENEIEDPDVPMAELPVEGSVDPNEEVIMDEDVPMADSAIQVTGDTIVIWLVLAGVSCVVITCAVVYDLRHKEH